MLEPSPSPIVSVVIGAYNSERTIERSIESLFAQTLPDIEIIVVNDGSRDSTRQRLESLQARDGRLRIIEQENAGLTAALIRGCNESRGKYIARQDSDDWSEPTRLQLQAAFLDAHPDVGFVACGARSVGPAGELLFEDRRDLDPVSATESLKRIGVPAHGSVMMRAESYRRAGGYRPMFYFAQDTDLWLRLREQGLFAIVPDVLYFFEIDPNTVSGAYMREQRQFARYAHECREARERGEREEPILAKAQALRDAVVEARKLRGLKTESPAMAYLIGSQLVKAGNPQGRNYLWQTLRKRPWHLKAWIRMTQSWFSSITGRNAPQSTGAK
jgi:glycosyltransferase involved in cell wall biosynthesis